MALGMPVRTMLSQLSSADLTEYMAFERIDGPIGEVRADLRAGIVASTVANHGMSPPKSPLRPIDFMPFAKPGGGGQIKLANAVEHGKLLAKTLFGGLLNQKKG